MHCRPNNKLAGLWVCCLVLVSADTMDTLQTSLQVSDWGSGAACGWPGVYCSLDYAVIAVSVVHQTFAGDLPEGVFPSLPELTTLVIVADGEQPLSLPQDICEANSLTQLELHHVVLGAFPEQLLACSQLEYLQLSSCSLTGGFPDVAAWTHLKILNLAENQLTGELPASLAQLPALEQVVLYNNQLEGEVPEFDSDSLQVLDIRHNQFSGSVPVPLTQDSLFYKASIVHFGFDGNALSLPDICTDITFCFPFK